jgi:putative inorganic carbon (hco3(-)) transporter
MQAMSSEVSMNAVTFPQVGKTPLLLFCGYILIWYLQIGSRFPALGAIRFEFIYAAVLTVLAIISTPQIERDCPLYLYIALYFAVIIIQVPFSYDYNRSCDIFSDRIVKFAFMTFFIISFVRNPSTLKYFLGAFLLACLKMGQEGLWGRIFGTLLWQNQGILRLHGPTPIYAHPNSFAGMAMGTLPFVFYLWPVANKYVRLALIALAVFSLNIVIYSGSRTSYVGLGVFAVYILVKSANKKALLLKLVAVAFLLAWFVPSDYFDRLQSISTHVDKEGRSTEKRIEIQKDAWAIFTSNPLGIGVSAFPKKRFDTFGRVQDTHNLYLEIGTNLGIQGLIVFFILIYKLLSTLNGISGYARLAILKWSDGSVASESAFIDDLKLIEAAAMATSAFVIVRLALGLFGMDLYEIYWWFAMGLTIALYNMMKYVRKFEPA